MGIGTCQPWLQIHFPAEALQRPFPEQSAPALKWHADSALHTCATAGFASWHNASATCVARKTLTIDL